MKYVGKVFGNITWRGKFKITKLKEMNILFQG